MTSAKPALFSGAKNELAGLAQRAGQLIGEHRALAIAVAAGAVAVVMAGYAWSARVGRRSLAHRQGLVLVPTEGFDPGVEEVLRFAAAMAGCRPARLAPRWSRAVRVHLGSVRGQLVYEIVGAPWLMAVLRSGTFSQVELRPASALVTVAVPTAPPLGPGPSLETAGAGPPVRPPGQQQQDQTVEENFETLAQ